MDSLEKHIIQRAKKLQAIARVEVPRAAARALNTTATAGRTQVVKVLTKSTKIKSADLKKKIFISRASYKKQRCKLSVYTTPVSAVSQLRSAVLMSNVRRGNNRRGVRVVGQQFNGAFINVYRASGRFQVFKRKKKKRYPLEVIKLPIQTQAEAALDSVCPKAMQRNFKKRLLHELNYRLSKYGETHA